MNALKWLVPILIATILDWRIGYELGIRQERARANVEIRKANAATETNAKEAYRIVGELRKANAAIARANRVNIELHDKLRAARAQAIRQAD